MEIITITKKLENGELHNYAFSSFERACESFPIIHAYPEEQFQINLPWGMNIHNHDTNINVKKCFVY